MTQSDDAPELVPLSEDPDCREAALPALDAWITPTDRFYVRSHFDVPQVDASMWRLSVEGEVDLSHRAGRGVFKAWDIPGVFERVSITSSRSIRWTEDAELCCDAVYLEITGRAPEEIMPGLRAHANA